jgi:hypothetical protein
MQLVCAFELSPVYNAIGLLGDFLEQVQVKSRSKGGQKTRFLVESFLRKALYPVHHQIPMSIPMKQQFYFVCIVRWR